MSKQDDVQFASLLASRLCHDLINPAGALNTGLDVLSTESDEELRQHADQLVKDATARLLASIEFARLAYGASGGAEGDLDVAAIKDLAQRLYAHLKPTLKWDLTVPALPKREGRILMNLLLCGERIAPRAGSEIIVEDAPRGFRIVAVGKRAKLPEDVAAAFAGEEDHIEPKAMPAALAKRLADLAGRTILCEVGEDVVALELA